MAYQKVSSPPGSDGQSAIVVGILAAIVTLVIAITLLSSGGYLRSESADDPRYAVTADAESEARPTAVWRFRDEWLTPRVP